MGNHECRHSQDMVTNLKRDGHIRGTLPERLLRLVDRGHFMTPEDREVAYHDRAWLNGYLHLSAPCIYAEVLSELDLRPGLSFLHLGSGTGYFSTLAGLALGGTGINHGVELRESNCEHARARVAEIKEESDAVYEFEFCEPHFVTGNYICLRASDSNRLQYDRIYCGSACPQKYVPKLKAWLAIGGLLIVPVDDKLMKYIRVDGDTWSEQYLMSVSFAPLQEPRQEPEASSDLELPPIDRVPSLQQLCRLRLRSALRETILASYDFLPPAPPNFCSPDRQEAEGPGEWAVMPADDGDASDDGDRDYAGNGVGVQVAGHDGDSGSDVDAHAAGSDADAHAAGRDVDAHVAGSDVDADVAIRDVDTHAASRDVDANVFGSDVDSHAGDNDVDFHRINCHLEAQFAHVINSDDDAYRYVTGRDVDNHDAGNDANIAAGKSADTVSTESADDSTNMDSDSTGDAGDDDRNAIDAAGISEEEEQYEAMEDQACGVVEELGVDGDSSSESSSESEPNSNLNPDDLILCRVSTMRQNFIRDVHNIMFLRSSQARHASLDERRAAAMAARAELSRRRLQGNADADQEPQEREMSDARERSILVKSAQEEVANEMLFRHAYSFKEEMQPLAKQLPLPPQLLRYLLAP